MEEEDDLPYAQRSEWKDVQPVPQDDGPNPLAVIRYPPGFEEVHDYFRAVQQRNEFSKRALKLTADIIGHNSANYTAWYYRRRCLKELGSDLEVELEFIDKWARDCPKNYQVWYHRRWIIVEMAEQLRRGEKPKDEVEKEISELAERELAYHLDVMQVNDDYKNYNGWSHRQFIVSRFNLWSKELQFVEDLLRDDIRNNSAWNHRFTVVRNTGWPSAATMQREIDYSMTQIRKCASNESAWNYMAAFLGEGEGKARWDSMPAVEQLCHEVIALAPEPHDRCRFAMEALAQVHEAKGQTEKALEQYALLKEIDIIRTHYWDWRATLLTA